MDEIQYNILESRINLRVALMREKYPRQCHAKIEQNRLSALQMLKDHNGKVPQLDISEELRFGLPALPISASRRTRSKGGSRRRDDRRRSTRR